MAEYQIVDGKEFFKEMKTVLQHEEQNHQIKLRIKFFILFNALQLFLYVTTFRNYDFEIQKPDSCEITNFRYHSHWNEYQIYNIVSVLFYHNG